MTGGDIRRFLETCSKLGTTPSHWPYRNLFDFILKNGKEFVTMANPDIEMGKKGECFMNAFKLAEFDDVYTYVEGYAYSVGIPMLHAWTVTKYGIVVDPTWSNGTAYYGVTFPLDYVREIMLRRGAYGVLDCWEIKWPLLTGDDEYPI